MKHFIKSCLPAFAAAFFMISCNSDEGNKTSENKDPGNADSVGNGQTNNNNVDNADADFLSFAAYSGMMEVEQGKVAQSKGQAAEIKNLGKMMVDEHTAMGQKVKALAAKKNVQLKDSLDTEDMDKIRNNKKTGKDFDRDYASEMVDDHEKAVKKFEDAANDAKDPEIKALANEALPKLRHHLEMSKAVKDKVKG
jgi:putative membrane protein